MTLLSISIVSAENVTTHDSSLNDEKISSDIDLVSNDELIDSNQNISQNINKIDIIPLTDETNINSKENIINQSTSSSTSLNNDYSYDEIISIINNMLDENELDNNLNSEINLPSKVVTSSTQETKQENITLILELPSIIYAGEKLNIKGTIYDGTTPITSGRITALLIGKLWLGSTNITNGQYSRNTTIPINYTGNYTLKISYINQENITIKTLTKTIEIIHLAKINMTVPSIGYVGSNLIINGTITNNSIPLEYGKMNIYLGSYLIGSASINNGYFLLDNSKTIPSNYTGTKTIKAVYVNSQNKVTNISLQKTIKINNTAKIFSYDEILNSSKIIETFLETKYKLPDYITMKDTNNQKNQVTMHNLLYLFTNIVNSKNNVKIINYGNITQEIETSYYNNSKINSTEYIKLSTTIVNYFKNQGRAPNEVKTTYGNLSFNDTLYLYAQILSYRLTNQKNITQITIKPVSRYIYVNSKGNGTGETYDSPTTLNNALNMVSWDTTIYLVTKNSDTYNETIYVEDYRVSAKKFKIEGQGNKTIIFNGNNKNRLLVIQKPYNVKIKNIKFINGYGDETSGVIYNRGIICIEKCIFTNNSAKYRGGVIYNNNGNVTITNSTFTNNSAYYKGGVMVNDHGKVILINNKFTNNKVLNNTYYSQLNETTSDGGVLYNYVGDAMLINNTFQNNHAQFGGVVCSCNSTLVLKNNKFIKNHAKMSGGCIGNYNSTLILSNNSMINNSAVYRAGILDAYNITLLCENNNIINNNAQYGGVFYLNTSITEIKNTIFTNNSAAYGGAIYYDYETFNRIENTSFINNTAKNWGGALGIINSTLVINNVRFNKNNINQTTGTGGAIYSENTGIYIDKSQFIENKAPSGGAITQLSNEITSITNSVFTKNNATRFYGGAIYTAQTSLNINKTKFNTNSAKIYGGAVYSQLNKIINIKYCELNNNNATKGQTIYTSQSSLDLEHNKLINAEKNSIFLENSPYFEKNNTWRLNNNSSSTKYTINNITNTTSKLTINQTTTISPTKVKPTMIAYDKIVTPGKYTQLSLETNENINGTVIVNINGTQVNMTLVKGKGTYNYKIPSNWTKYYNQMIKVRFTFNGNKNYQSRTISINLYVQKNNNTFNLKNYGLVTSIKSQGNAGSCWAHSSLGALESAILKTYGKTYDFSENYMKNMINKYSLLGTNVDPNWGSSVIRPINYLVSWIDPVNEINDTYSDRSALSIDQNSSFHVQNVVYIPNRKNETDNDIIKESILKYGAIATDCYYNDSLDKEYKYTENGVYRLSNTNWYTDTDVGPNHAVMIVGWDDTYDKNHFNNSGKIPENNGAFIIKNSYGTSYGDDGYVYVSYYDKTIAGTHKTYLTNFAFKLNDTKQFNTIYQNEITSGSAISLGYSDDVWIKNEYTAKNNESIQAIGTYFLSKTSYYLTIYKNGCYQTAQSGNIDTIGYNTIELENYVQLEENDVFTIQIRLTNNEGFYSTMYVQTQDSYDVISNNQTNSYISRNGRNWTNLNECKLTAALKVYTAKTKQLKTETTQKNNQTIINTQLLNNNQKGNITIYLNNTKVKELKNVNLTSQQIIINGTGTINIEVTTTTETIKQIIRPLKEQTTQNTKNKINVTKTVPSVVQKDAMLNNITKQEKRFLNYTLEFPLYANITLNNVIKTNTTYDQYIVKLGENGIIKIPVEKNITITINSKTYAFDGNNLKNETKYIYMNGNARSCKNSDTPNYDGIHVMLSNSTIIVRYYANITKNITQFTITSNSNNNIETLKYKLNNNTTVIITASENYNYKETGFKNYLNQLLKVRYNITDCNSYNEILSHIPLPYIKYTLSNQQVFEGTYNHYEFKKQINDYITTILTYNDTRVTRIQKVTYRNTINNNIEAIQTYTIVKSELTKNTLLKYENKTIDEEYKTFLLGLRTVYLNDVYINTINNVTNITWNRVNAAIILTGKDVDGVYISCPNNTMGITVSGQKNKVYLFNLLRTIGLSNIETMALNSTYGIDVKSNLDKVIYAVNYGNYTVSLKDNCIYVQSLLEDITIKLDTNTGIVTDYLEQENNIYHGTTNVDVPDNQRTSLLNLPLDSTGANAERFAGTMLMTIGFATLPEGIALIVGGALISADANGVFRNKSNHTRLANFAVDFITSAPLAKCLSILKGAPVIETTTLKVAEMIKNVGTTSILESYFQKENGLTNTDIFMDSVFGGIPGSSIMETIDIPIRSSTLEQLTTRTSKNANQIHQELLDSIKKLDAVTPQENGKIPLYSEYETFIKNLNQEKTKVTRMLFDVYETNKVTKQVLVKTTIKTIVQTCAENYEEEITKTKRNLMNIVEKQVENVYIA
ncbi:C1 family peptidase [Methanosphaera sp.]